MHLGVLHWYYFFLVWRNMRAEIQVGNRLIVHYSVGLLARIDDRTKIQRPRKTTVSLVPLDLHLRQTVLPEGEVRGDAVLAGFKVSIFVQQIEVVG